MIEDHGDFAEVLAATLRLEGVEVRVAADSATGSRLATEARSDLTFVDLGLPDMDGLELGRRLRALDATTVLVALSGHSEREVGAKCLSAGLDRSLTKRARRSASCSDSSMLASRSEATPPLTASIPSFPASSRRVPSTTA